MTSSIQLDLMRRERLVIDRCLRELQEQAKAVQERCEMVRGSVYKRRRRCGKRNCGCWDGPAHEGWVLSVRRGGKSVWVSLKDEEGERMKALVENHQRFRHARQKMIQTWQRLLTATDELGWLRQSGTEAER